MMQATSLQANEMMERTGSKKRNAALVEAFFRERGENGVHDWMLRRVMKRRYGMNLNSSPPARTALFYRGKIVPTYRRAVRRDKDTGKIITRAMVWVHVSFAEPREMELGARKLAHIKATTFGPQQAAFLQRLLGQYAGDSSVAGKAGRTLMHVLANPVVLNRLQHAVRRSTRKFEIST